MNPIFFIRGAVFIIEITPYDPNRPENNIPKYALNLQEGKVVENADTFVCLLLTTEKSKLKKKYPWDVFLTPQESKTQEGAKICCNQVYTIKKDCIKDYAYTLSEPTMKEVDEKLILGLCIGNFKIEDTE